MFGYIQPDDPYLFKKDEVLYKALYCGLCKSIGKGCGQFARSALTFDIAFMSAIIHNIRGEDVVIKKQRCGLHILKRRPMTLNDKTSELLGCINTVLAYYKLYDDKLDGDKKGVLRHLYKKGLKRVKKRHPQIEKIVSEQTKRQREIEKSGCDIIDMACEPTSCMMQELSDYALKEWATEDTKKLFYSLGKWVYLADAIDDYNKDVKKQRYNVLYNAYKKPCLEQVLKDNREEINFIFDSLFADMRTALSKIKFHFNHDLTDNIILRGIPIKTKNLINDNCKNNQCTTENKN